MRTVQNAQSLITTQAATVEGFKWQAQKKLELGKSFYDLATKFRQKGGNIRRIGDLERDPDLYQFAVMSCSLSEKSRKHIDSVSQLKIIAAQWDFKKLADDSYCDELLARFYLTAGDSLGGQMRNEIGKRAARLFTKVIIEELLDKNIKYKVKEISNGKIQMIEWDHRALLFDKKPSFYTNSIDFALLAWTGNTSLDSSDAKQYVACGELKGGIDPAGADEHWKTAKGALERIRVYFQNAQGKSPAVYFVGAAIEAAMANEIFAELTGGRLTAAANLNNAEQVKELVSNLISH